MPVTVSSSSRHGSNNKERRLSSSSHGSRSASRRAPSTGGAARTVNSGGSSSNKPTYMSSAASTLSAYMPSVLRTSSMSSSSSTVDNHPPIKSILVVNNNNSSNNVEQDKNTASSDDPSSSAANTSPSSYLKPLLKFLPRHIDPSTIARLLKNVHPTAFGSYKTKEVWRKEHPEVLNTAQYLLAQEQREEEARARGIFATSSTSSLSVDEFCLAHSPPSATFSSSSEEEEEGSGGEEDEEAEEARELNELFDEEDEDPFDTANLGSSPESVSSLRDLAERRDSFTSSNSSHGHHNVRPPRSISSGKAKNNNSKGKGREKTIQVRSTGQDGDVDDDNTVEIISINPPPPPSRSSSIPSPPRSPLAILVSRPKEDVVTESPDSETILRSSSNSKEEVDNHSNDRSLKVGDVQTDDKGSDGDTSSGQRLSHESVGQIPAVRSSSSSSRRSIIAKTVERDESPAPGDSNITVTQGNITQQQLASISTALPSPSSSSLPSPSFPSSSTFPLSSPLSPNSPSSSLAPIRQRRPFPSPTADQVVNPTASTSTSTSTSISPNGYPTIAIPKQVRRQRSSSSLASACTCRSNTSNISNASGTSSRSSSVRFAPLPEDELLLKRKESAQRASGGSGNDKSRIMGIKGRRTLLLGKTDDGKSVDEILRASKNDHTLPVLDASQQGKMSPSLSQPYPQQTSHLGYRRPVLTEEVDDEYNLYGNDDDDDGDSDRDRDRDRGRGLRRKNDPNHFDAIAYFEEVDSVQQPIPSVVIVDNLGNNKSENNNNNNSRTRSETVQSSSDGGSANGHQDANSAPLSSSSSPSSQGPNAHMHYFRKQWTKTSDPTLQYGKNGELVEKRPLGVTLEELTLPMKRVKETRGRSRQTLDLSASFSGFKNYIHSSGNTATASAPSSLPNSPGKPTIIRPLQKQQQQQQQQQQYHQQSIPGVDDVLSESSPSRSYIVNKKRTDEVSPSKSASSIDASEKTPVPTPRFEKIDLFLTAMVPSSPSNTISPKATLKMDSTGSVDIVSSPSNSSRINPTAPLSPPSSASAGTGVSAPTTNGASTGSSPTSPSNSSGFSGGSSNDITPMPTPRAGSPVAGLKMTAAVFAHNEASKRDFKLFETLSTRRGSNASSGSSNSSGGPGGASASGMMDNRVLSRISKLDDDLTRSSSPSGTSPVPSLSTSTSNSSPEPEDGVVDATASHNGGSVAEQDEWDSDEQDEDDREEDEEEDQAYNGHEKVQELEILGSRESDDSTSSGVFESGDYDKTPTLHSTLALPTIYDTVSTSKTSSSASSSSAALAPRFRKKIVVATPHVTAKKRGAAKKIKKTT